MSITGTVERGVIKLPPEAGWPDGTSVRVERIETPRSRNRLTQRLREMAVKVEGLPSDLAAQHDHYIHGTPKHSQP